MAKLQLTGVGKAYASAIRMLNDINLEIESGELIVFVEPSGCSKSTLGECYAGVLR